MDMTVPIGFLTSMARFAILLGIFIEDALMCSSAHAQ